MRRRAIVTACLLLALSPLGAAFATTQTARPASGAPIRIGVLALRGAEEAHRQYDESAAYLTREIPGTTFEVVPLDFDALELAVAADEVEFVIVNSSYYVTLEARYGATRIATMLRRMNDDLQDRFGSVIFTRADSGITTLADVRGSTFMAVHRTSFGGWQMSLRELVDAGIDPERECEFTFSGSTHDEVVSAVLAGEADAGCVRTGILEAMAGEGAIDLEDVRVLAPQSPPGFSELLSTRLYPEWAFAKTRAADRDLAEEVASALYRMRDREPAALVGDVGGWTVPLDYYEVHELLRELRLPPYERATDFTLFDAVRRYWAQSLIAAVVLVLLVGAVALASRLNRRLAHANDELARANEAKSRFLTKMSHELRTPLNSIIGFSGLMLKGMTGELSGEQRTQLEMVNDSGRHLLALVNDVLDLSRIEAGTLVFSPTDIQVSRVMESVRSSFGETARAKGLEFAVDDQTGGLRLRTDEARLKQVLFNLVENAIKFTDAGAVRVVAHADAGAVRFSVSDTGCGIPADRAERIFEEFHQIAPTDGGLTQGLGLGLAISKSLASLLGGRLTLRESQTDEGCTFELSLPLGVTE